MSLSILLTVNHQSIQKSPLRLVLFLCLLTCLLSGGLQAVTSSETTATQPALKPLSKARVSELASMWTQINANRVDLQELESRVEQDSVIMSQVLERRTDRLWEQTIKLCLTYCEQVADLRDGGYDVAPQTDNAILLLDEVPPNILLSVARIRERVVMPDFAKPALEQIATDRQFYDTVRLYSRINLALLDTYRIAVRYEIDLAALKATALERIESSAVNTSIFLDLALMEVNNLHASLAVMPEDTEQQAKLRVAEIRVHEVIKMLTVSVESLASQGISTTQYRRQLLGATGAVSMVSLDLHVLVKVLQDWWSNIVDFIVTNGPNFIFQALLFLVIVSVFYKLANVVRRLVSSALKARHVGLSRLMQLMIESTARGITIFVGVLIALSQFNISLGPMLAGLGIAGFIVGFALQDSLSNFASGMMILFYKPFDVGDSVVAGGVRGKVSSMSLVNTTIRTFDNQSLIVPNNKIWQEVITNVTDQRVRRIDMEFGITYDEDIDRVERILHGLLADDKRVLKEPEARIIVGSFGDSSVNILCRPWVCTDDYWEVLWDLNKRVKQAFDREGVVIPFPQRDVHLHTQSPVPSADVEPPLKKDRP